MEREYSKNLDDWQYVTNSSGSFRYKWVSSYIVQLQQYSFAKRIWIDCSEVKKKELGFPSNA